MNSKKPSLWGFIGLFFLVVFLVMGCSGDGSGGGSSQGDASEQATQFSIEMSALKKQESTTTISSFLASFVAGDVYTGELMVTNTATLESETHFWSVYIDDETFAVQSNKTIVLEPGNYDISLEVERGDQQYAGTALGTDIVEGTNSVALTLRPIIGDSDIDVSVVSTLAAFKFSYSPTELSGIAAPHMGIIVDSDPEEIFAINPATGISDSYISIDAGVHTVQLKLYDAALQIGKSVPAQESPTIVPGLALSMDIIPLYSEMAIALAEAGGDADFTFTIPGEIVDEAGGTSDLTVLFKSVGSTNPYQETTLTLTADGSDYVADTTLSDFQFGSVTFSLDFIDITDSYTIATCNMVTMVDSSSRTLACDVALHKRALISGNLMGVVGINVFDTDDQPVAGAMVFDGTDLLGVTGSGSFGTAGYLKMYMISGTHNLRAETTTHYGEATASVPVLGTVNPDIVLDSTLGGSGMLVFEGDVEDAPVAYADVTLINHATKVAYGTPTTTGPDGDFTLVVPSSGIPAGAILALQVDGRQYVPGGLIPECSPAGPEDPDTYVDIDKNGVYTAPEDACLGEKASFVSILGTEENISALGLASGGIIDDANLPELLVTHVTTAEALVLEQYITDPSDDAVVAAFFDSMETALEFEEQLQKQVAVIGAIYRAFNHELDMDSPIDLPMDESADAIGVEGLIDAIIAGDYILNTDEIDFLEDVIANDDSLALSGLMTVATDLSGVDFDATSDTIGDTDPTLSATLDANFETILDHFITTLKSDPADPDLTSDFMEYYHTDFMQNGKSGEQNVAQYVDMVQNGMEDGGGYLIDASHDGTHLVRHADAGGLVFYDELSGEFVNTEAGNLPVYVKHAIISAEFPSSTYTFPIDNPQMGMDGFVVYDSSLPLGNQLRELGNLEKFDVNFRARNEQGRKEIELFVDDEFHGATRYDIQSIVVEINDANLDALTAAQLEWPNGEGTFRNDCTLAQAQVQNDPMNNYQCLNLIVLFFNDWHEDGPFWGTDGYWHGNDVEKSFVIPVDWTPNQYTEFTITVIYDDTVTLATDLEEVYSKSLRLFPTEEYLAKLLFDDGDGVIDTAELVNLVDGDHSIGDNSGLSLHWRFRDTYNSDEFVFPSDANINISLWDPILEENVPGFDVQLPANQRSIEITGDLSGYFYLTLQIQLELADGSRADAEYLLIKNSGWIAYPFESIVARETYHTTANKMTGDLSTDVYSNLSLSSAFGRITSGSVNYELVDYDPLVSDSFVFRDFESWVAEDGSGGWLDFRKDGLSPHINISFTPDYNSTFTTILSGTFFDALAGHQVSSLSITRDASTDQAIVEWTAPTLNTMMSPHDSTAYQVRFSFDDGTSVYEDYEYYHLDDTLRYESIPLTVTDADTNSIRVEIQAIHFDWLVVGSFELICSPNIVAGGTCSK